MLMVIKPDSENKAKEIFNKWELDFSVIGEVTDSSKIVLYSNDKIVADIPLNL